MRVRILDDGMFVTDAGNLFGGSRKASIKGAMHPILVEAGDDLVLIDAGFGPELPEMLVGRYELRSETRTSWTIWKRRASPPGDVTHVILSHLDADHVGWALNPPSFPNATVYVQEAALEEAREMPESDGRRAAVPRSRRASKKAGASCWTGTETYCPASGSRCERALRGAPDRLDRDGRRSRPSTPADLAPAKIWLDPDLIAGVDTDPEAARKNRIEVLDGGRGARRARDPLPRTADCLVKVRSQGDGSRLSDGE